MSKSNPQVGDVVYDNFNNVWWFIRTIKNNYYIIDLYPNGGRSDLVAGFGPVFLWPGEEGCPASPGASQPVALEDLVGKKSVDKDLLCSCSSPQIKESIMPVSGETFQYCSACGKERA